MHINKSVQMDAALPKVISLAVMKNLSIKLQVKCEQIIIQHYIDERIGAF
jgi:hypothetical protein